MADGIRLDLRIEQIDRAADREHEYERDAKQPRVKMPAPNGGSSLLTPLFAATPESSAVASINPSPVFCMVPSHIELQAGKQCPSADKIQSEILEIANVVDADSG